ncbi:hypothetical protein NDU88_000583 [Pleurodeles waltl]|uniref:Uncharacterized protein n=1 Tax=Pleurodeles waltl TaxID=8319 RepID=A0AAV7LIZ1_PLEWA|nr:hypothetical protein NDU88_000583 [Pleurodeles waltl]
METPTLQLQRERSQDPQDHKPCRKALLYARMTQETTLADDSRAEATKHLKKSVNLHIGDYNHLGPHLTSLLRTISSDLQAMRKLVENYFEQQEIAEEWLRMGLILDTLIYRVYLLFMLVYALILGSTWGSWYHI